MTNQTTDYNYNDYYDDLSEKVLEDYLKIHYALQSGTFLPVPNNAQANSMMKALHGFLRLHWINKFDILSFSLFEVKLGHLRKYGIL